ERRSLIATAEVAVTTTSDTSTSLMILRMGTPFIEWRYTRFWVKPSLTAPPQPNCSVGDPGGRATAPSLSLSFKSMNPADRFCPEFFPEAVLWLDRFRSD